VRAREAAEAAGILGVSGLPRLRTGGVVLAGGAAAGGGVVSAVAAGHFVLPYPQDAHPDHLAVTRIGGMRV